MTDDSGKLNPEQLARRERLTTAGDFVLRLITFTVGALLLLVLCRQVAAADDALLRLVLGLISCGICYLAGVLIGIIRGHGLGYSCGRVSDVLAGFAVLGGVVGAFTGSGPGLAGVVLVAVGAVFGMAIAAGDLLADVDRVWEPVTQEPRQVHRSR